MKEKRDKISSYLITYIENKVFPIYLNNEKGHGIDHINYVIDRSLELSDSLDVNLNMVYTIASYHDIGHYVDAKNHEKISAEMMSNDINLKRFFNDEQLSIIKEAIYDHRASFDGEPRSIYGKIVSSADRNISVDDAIERTYLYIVEHYSDYTLDQIIDRSYNHLKEKFGVNGYANSFIRDAKYEKYLKDLQSLLANKEQFVKRHKKIIKKMCDLYEVGKKY